MSSEIQKFKLPLEILKADTRECVNPEKIFDISIAASILHQPKRKMRQKICYLILFR